MGLPVNRAWSVPAVTCDERKRIEASMNVVNDMMKAVAGVLLRPYTQMPGRTFRGVLPGLTFNQSEVAENCEKHVRALAADIGERHIGRIEALDDSVNYIEKSFTDSGYTPAFHTFELLGRTLYNVEAVLKGRSRRSIVVGAHYDSIPGCRGADDNASGVAALLEVARLLRQWNPTDTIRFVAFANEEHPGLPDTTLGSYDFARNCKARKMEIRGMMVLEMLGYFSDQPGSQRYPYPFSLL
ncbi:MAG: M20/M25/M40 family metallo-hydrolase, partial [Cyanobacteria bacterium]|nr:M20/M25/M40 family metallo-hydrolase [Cyanobacteriota bacterium]